MEVGARPRSILDQTIEGRSTDLFFFFIQYNRGKDRKVPYRDNRHSQRILRALGIPLPSVRLSRGGNRTTGKDPADLPGARGRALFKREWGVNRKASVFVLGFWGLSFGLLSILFVVGKGEGV